MTDTVIFVALEDEFSGPIPANMRIVYTGVGKVNAALVAACVLSDMKPKLAINFGTAGAVKPGLSGLIECGAAVQRDMDLRPLGLPLGKTFGDAEPDELRWAEGPVVGTGDSFAAAVPELPSDLVDMEAYALAKACLRAHVPFRCIKFVSDSADEGAPSDWQANKARGAALFGNWLTSI